MTKRSKRMQRVQSLAENEERDYCRAMGDAQRALDDHVARLHELENYRRDYLARGADGGNGQAMSSARYADYQNFIGRLDEAVAAQAEVVRTTEQNRDAHRQRWLVKRRQTESLKRVVERYREDEDRAEALSQQKQLDDLPRRDDPFREA